MRGDELSAFPKLAASETQNCPSGVSRGRYAGFAAMLPIMAEAANRVSFPRISPISNSRGHLHGEVLGVTALSGRGFRAMGDRECKVKKRSTLGGTIAKQFNDTLIPF